MTDETALLYRKQGKRYVPVPDQLDTWSGFMVLCSVRDRKSVV